MIFGTLRSRRPFLCSLPPPAPLPPLSACVRASVRGSVQKGRDVDGLRRMASDAPILSLADVLVACFETQFERRLAMLDADAPTHRLRLALDLLSRHVEVRGVRGRGA